jgi:hypothetical protein
VKDLQTFTTCCQKDKVTLPSASTSAQKYPAYLEQLLMGSSEGEIVIPSSQQQSRS